MCRSKLMKALPVLALVCGSQASAKPAPAVTSLCELAANPEKWRGRTVRLRAIYVTDRMHSSILEDRRCPSIWFEVRHSKNFDRASLASFRRAVFDIRKPTTPDMMVDIEGRVSFKKTAKTARGTITIRKLFDFDEAELSLLLRSRTSALLTPAHGAAQAGRRPR